MKNLNKNIIQQAAMAAAFSAVFNTDWFKGQLERLKRDMSNGDFGPYVPWLIGAAGVYMMMGRR